MLAHLATVYEFCGKAMVADTLDGYKYVCAPLLALILSCCRSGTLFAYGQTGSGKTHSMFGQVESPSELPSSPELI